MNSSRASFFNDPSEVAQYLNLRIEKLINDSGDSFNYDNLSNDEKTILILSRLASNSAFQIESNSSNSETKNQVTQNINQEEVTSSQDSNMSKENNSNLKYEIDFDDLYIKISSIVNDKSNENQNLKNVTQAQKQQLHDLYSISTSLDTSTTENDAKLDSSSVLNPEEKQFLDQYNQVKSEIHSLEIDNLSIKQQISNQKNNNITNKPNNDDTSTPFSRLSKNEKPMTTPMTVREQNDRLNRMRSLIDKLERDNKSLEMQITSYERRIKSMQFSTKSYSKKTRISLAERALMNAPPSYRKAKGNEPSENNRSPRKIGFKRNMMLPELPEKESGKKGEIEVNRKSFAHKSIRTRKSAKNEESNEYEYEYEDEDDKKEAEAEKVTKTEQNLDNDQILVQKVDNQEEGVNEGKDEAGVVNTEIEEEEEMCEEIEKPDSGDAGRALADERRDEADEHDGSESDGAGRVVIEEEEAEEPGGCGSAGKVAAEEEEEVGEDDDDVGKVVIEEEEEAEKLDSSGSAGRGAAAEEEEKPGESNENDEKAEAERERDEAVGQIVIEEEEYEDGGAAEEEAGEAAADEEDVAGAEADASAMDAAKAAEEEAGESAEVSESRAGEERADVQDDGVIGQIVIEEEDEDDEEASSAALQGAPANEGAAIQASGCPDAEQAEEEAAPRCDERAPGEDEDFAVGQIVIEEEDSDSDSEDRGAPSDPVICSDEDSLRQAASKTAPRDECPFLRPPLPQAPRAPASPRSPRVPAALSTSPSEEAPPEEEEERASLTPRDAAMEIVEMIQQYRAMIRFSDPLQGGAPDGQAEDADHGSGNGRSGQEGE